MVCLMNFDTKTPAPAALIMDFGADPAAAASLAQAIGLPLQTFDMQTLAQSLRQGQRCVVVWSDPQNAVAQALRTQTVPSVAAAQWLQSGQDLLALFARNRRTLLLVAASLITRGSLDDLSRLAARLPLTVPLVQAKPSPDLAEQLGRLIAAHLSDLRPVWEELQASSLSPHEEVATSVDLDPVAQLLADQKAATRRGSTEIALLRAEAADLLDKLSAADARHAADRQSLIQSEQEIALLRDQVSALNQASIAETAADQSAKEQTERAMTAELSSLERANAKALTELELLRSQLVAVSQGTHKAREPDTTEVDLLREQLAAVSAMITKVPNDGIGADHVMIEAAFASLLAALVSEVDSRRKAELDAPPSPRPRNRSGRRHPVPARPDI